MVDRRCVPGVHVERTVDPGVTAGHLLHLGVGLDVDDHELELGVLQPLEQAPQPGRVVEGHDDRGDRRTAHAGATWGSEPASWRDGRPVSARRRQTTETWAAEARYPNADPAPAPTSP